MIDQKMKNYSSFIFLPENLEKFRSTELYGVPLGGSIRRAKIWNFSSIAQKIKNNSSFNFLPENLEKFCLTELYGAALEGSTIFLCRSLGPH